MGLAAIMTTLLQLPQNIQKPKGKVLLIAPQPFYEERGTPMNVRLMSTILGRAGYSVDLLVFPTGIDMKIPGVRIIRLPNIIRTQHIPIGFSWEKLLFDFFLPFIGVWLCIRNKYKVIHGVEEGGVVAVFLSRFFRKCGTIYDMDSVMSDQFASQEGKTKIFKHVVRLLEHWAMRRASVVLTVCQALSATARLIVPSAKIVQIEDIPLEFAFPLESNQRLIVGKTVGNIIQRFGLEKNKILLYTGNLQPYQGIDMLLKAWGSFIHSVGGGSGFRLVIVGGPKELVHKYTSQIEAFDWHDSVCFIGPRPSEEMGVWMDTAHCLISPRSQGENTPLKIYTYMAAGKPIIATRIKTHTQVLTDETAFLVAPKADNMTQVIKDVFLDDALGVRKGKAALSLVQQQYNYEMFTEKLLKAYALASEGTTNCL